MNIRNIAASLFVCLSAGVGLAQPSSPPVPAAPPAAPVPPIPPEAAVDPQPKVVEGILMKSQRASSDRGKYEWVCTYRVAGTTRNVQLEESCPQSMPFALKK